MNSWQQTSSWISNPKSDHPLNVHTKCISKKNVSFWFLQHEDSNLLKRDINWISNFTIIVNDTMIKAVHASSTYARENWQILPEGYYWTTSTYVFLASKILNLSSVDQSIGYFKKEIRIIFTRKIYYYLSYKRPHLHFIQYIALFLSSQKRISARCIKVTRASFNTNKKIFHHSKQPRTGLYGPKVLVQTQSTTRRPK